MTAHPPEEGWYIPADDPQLAVRHRHVMSLARTYAQTFYPTDTSGTEGTDTSGTELTDTSGTDRDAALTALLAELFGAVGADVEIRPPFTLDFGSNISIGDRTYIGANLTALDVAAIRIGDDCQIGPGVQLLTPTHPLEARARREKWESAEPITIGDNVWLGGGVTVCPGVTIGDDAVIGAGSVVTRDIPAATLAVGNPARVIRQLG